MIPKRSHIVASPFWAGSAGLNGFPVLKGRATKSCIAFTPQFIKEPEIEGLERCFANQFPMITYFIHSTSIDNERIVRSGWQNLGLLPTGREQAQQLRDIVAKADFDLVFASDLLWAKETAQIVFPSRKYTMLNAQRLKAI